MLDAVRVLDLTGEPGFLAGKILGDLGADVLKLEPPGGDPDRRGPFLGDVADPERSLAWLALNTSKRGITLDIASEAGRGLLERLLAGTDVLLDSFPPDRGDALGLGWERLHAAFPGLILARITPFGADGPHATYRGRDLVAVAMGGNLALTGDPDRPPVRCSLPTAYHHAAPEAALGIVMALHHREATGRGQRVDVSLQECQLQTLLGGVAVAAASGRKPRRAGARIGSTREIWACKDGWVSFGLRGGAARIPNLVATVEWMTECGAAPVWLRDTDWREFDPRRLAPAEVAAFEEAFGSFFRTRTMRELYEEALARRILLAPCNDAREILEHRQLRAREHFVRVEQPRLGACLEHPDSFARTEDRAVRVRRPAPGIGEHNAEVYGALGVGEAELARLREAGVV